MAITYMQKTFPRVFAAFKQFKDGSRNLFKDGRIYWQFKPEKENLYTPQQIVTYHEFKHDLSRCLPVFAIFWIPFVGQWIALPLGVMFPRIFLSRQFWTPDQRIYAYDHALDKRKKSHDLLLKSLTENIDKPKNDPKVVQLCLSAIEQKLEKGIPLTVPHEVDVFRRLFKDDQHLHYGSMKDTHKIDLASTFNLRSDQLVRHAVYLNNVDRSLIHFGTAGLSGDLIDLICHQRGVQLKGMQADELQTFLKLWLLVSKDLNAHELGYYLHLPVLLRNNQRLTDGS